MKGNWWVVGLLCLVIVPMMSCGLSGGEAGVSRGVTDGPSNDLSIDSDLESSRILIAAEDVSAAGAGPGSLYLLDPASGIADPVEAGFGIARYGQQSVRGDLVLVDDGQGSYSIITTVNNSSRPLIGPNSNLTSSPVISPDSRAIAFGSEDGIGVISPAGLSSRLVLDTRFVEELVWSPDSAFIAFEGPTEGTLSILDLETGARDTIATKLPGILEMAWHPGGDLLAVLLSGSQGMSTLATFDLRTDEYRELRDQIQVDSDVSIAWSSDGRQLLVPVRMSDQSGGRVSALLLVDSEGQSRVVETPGHTTLLSPQWSPDSKQVVAASVGAHGPERSYRTEPSVILIDVEKGIVEVTPFFGYPQSWAPYGLDPPAFVTDPIDLGIQGRGVLPEARTRDSSSLGCAPCEDVVHIDATADGIVDAVGLLYVGGQTAAPVLTIYDGSEDNENVSAELVGSTPAVVNDAFPFISAVLPGENASLVVVYSDRISGSRFFEAWRIDRSGLAEQIDGLPFSDSNDGSIGSFWGCEFRDNDVSVVSSELAYDPLDPWTGLQSITTYRFDGAGLEVVEVVTIRHRLDVQYGSVLEQATYPERACIEREK